MSAFTPYASSFISGVSGYIPAAVKDAAGLFPKISEDVRHITWLSIERVFWPPRGSVRPLLLVGYTDGFQVWDLQEQAKEVCSKQDKAVLQARMLPVPTPQSCSWAARAAPAPESGAEEEPAGGRRAEGDEEKVPLGIAAAPMMAYLHRGALSLVRLFSLSRHEDVHFLRLTEPARSMQASRRYIGIGFARRVELYDALSFQALFGVDCNAVSATAFALGHRWLAYNMPAQKVAAPAGGVVGRMGSTAAMVLSGGSQQLQTAVKDGMQYLGQGVQRAVDSMLMPPSEGADAPLGAPSVRGGVVAVRDGASQRVIARFECHAEPVEAMAWDPSGLQLVTGAGLGHRFLVHRALLGSEQSLMLHDPEEGGLSLGSVVFQHVYTLCRGITPAVISDITVSDDGQLVALASAKGTAHVFRLPPLHSFTLAHHRRTTGVAVRPRAEAAEPLQLAPCTRVRLGHVLLQEGLMPKCAFTSLGEPPSVASGGPTQREAFPRMFVATRTGSLAMYSLFPGPPAAPPPGGARGGEGAGAGERGGPGDVPEWQAALTRETHFCRPLRHFSERRLNLRDLPGGGSSGSRKAPQQATGPTGAQPGETSPGSFARSPPGDASPLPSPRLRPAPAEEGDPRPGSELSRWLADVEVRTQAPPQQQLPLWLCPQLSFHTYAPERSARELNAALRSGRAPPGRRAVPITRRERPGGEGVSIEGLDEEQLGRLRGALSAAIEGDASPPSPESPWRRPGRVSLGPVGVGAGSVTLAPAWDELATPEGVDGAVPEEVEDDWLKM